VVGGGSTLTQQLSKNLFLLKSGTAERSLRRKVQEVMLAIQIERNYTKDQILTMYCNEIFLVAASMDSPLPPNIILARISKT
jgi:membrane peptidoglycan carboxypeptidase